MNAPSSIFQVPGLSVAGFQPLKVLPSKMLTNPSSASAAVRRAMATFRRMQAVTTVDFMARRLQERSANNNGKLPFPAGVFPVRSPDLPDRQEEPACAPRHDFGTDVAPFAVQSGNVVSLSVFRLQVNLDQPASRPMRQWILRIHLYGGLLCAP